MSGLSSRNVVVVRALKAVRVLRTGRPTLSELATALGTTERTARRYLDALAEAHVPVKRHGPRYRIEGAL